MSPSPTPAGASAPPAAVQLWTIRDHYDDLPAALQHLTALGFTQVEAWGFTWATDLAPALRAAGLPAPTGHATLIGGELDTTFAAAKEVGVRTVIEAWTEPERWQHADDVRAMAEELNAAAKAAAAVGLRVGYHNHDHDFSSLLDGRPAFELFVEQLDDDVVLEIDVHMVQVGGLDPLAVLRRHADRVIAVHLFGEPALSVTAARDAAAVRAVVPHAVPIVELHESQTDVFGVLATASALLAGTAAPTSITPAALLDGRS